MSEHDGRRNFNDRTRALDKCFGTDAQHIYIAREVIRNVEAATIERCAEIAQTTICDIHLPTNVKIYGTRAAAAIRALGDEK